MHPKLTRNRSKIQGEIPCLFDGILLSTSITYVSAKEFDPNVAKAGKPMSVQGNTLILHNDLVLKHNKRTNLFLSMFQTRSLYNAFV